MGSVPSRNMSTTDSKKAASMHSTIGISELVTSTEQKPGMIPQQTDVPDDVVLSLFTDFENELLGEEFLFTV